MKNLLSFLLPIIVFASTGLFAQMYRNTPLDSLETLLETVPKNQKKEIINEIIRKLDYDFPQKSLDYYDSLELLSGESDSLAKLEIALGRNECWYYLGEPGLANYYYHISDSLAKAYKSPRYQYYFLKRQSIFFANISNIPGALNCFQQIDSISLANHDTLDYVVNLINFSTMYSLIDSVDLRLEYLLMANKFRYVLKSEKRVAHLWANMALSYTDTDSLEMASRYLDKLDSLNENLKDVYLEGVSLYVKTELLIKRKEYEKAIPMAKKALATNKKLGNLHYIADSYYFIGKSYFYLGDMKNALGNLRKCLEISTENHFDDSSLRAYPLLHSVYARMRDYGKAYRNLLAYKTLLDSTQTEKYAKEMLGLKEKYESEKKKKGNKYYCWKSNCSTKRRKGRRKRPTGNLPSSLVLLRLSFCCFWPSCSCSTGKIPCKGGN